MKYHKLVVLGVVASLFWLMPAMAQGVQDFTISNFEVNYQLQGDTETEGSLRVEETIVAEFPETDQNHGIERSLPQTYKGNNLELDIRSVTNESEQPRPYTTYKRDDFTIIRIGDANSYVHGQQTYVISYRVSDVVTFYESHDELFWDVNGTDWAQPMDRVAATIKLTPELAKQLKPELRCYTGSFGSTDQSCSISRDGQQITVEATELEPRENLSFVLGFEDGTFYQNPWPARLRVAKYVVAAVVPLTTFAFMFGRWYGRGRDAKGRGTIVPQYTPPEDLGVLESLVIMHTKLKPSDIGAAMIELATDGYVKLTETVDDKLFGKDDYDYTLQLVKDASDLSPARQKIVKALFGSLTAENTATVTISDKQHKLSSTLSSVNKQLQTKLTGEGYFKSNPTRIVGKYVGFAGVAGAIGGLFGFLELPLLLASFFAAGGIILAFGLLMPALSAKGTQTKEYLLGMKDYIQLAEADRIKYLQSPEGARQFGDVREHGTDLKIYEHLLPYAMLFGIEDQWAKQFEGLSEQAPQWLNATGSNFSANNFTNSINHVNSSVSNAFSPASSSGSSGGSGFGGGGSSGGGGGGGGGGGW